MSLHPVPLAAAVALVGLVIARRRKLGRTRLAGTAFVAVACALLGLGVIPVPNVIGIVERVGRTLGVYTYVLVGVLAFLETGAFIGLVAPGETAVLVGGVVAGQGEINPILLIALVWACAVAGDLTSYTLGRRLGRAWLLRHGPRLKITEERLVQVEGFFDRLGGMTILVGRFIGLVRALAPFIAGTSRMPVRKFLPFDVVGAGLWSALFVMLGYVFWRSLGTVTAYVGRGLFVFAVLVGLVVAGIYVRRLVRHAPERARARGWIDRHPPVRRVADALWPLIRRAIGPARFVSNRLTPGDLGLELTTLLAFAAVGGFGFFAIADLLDAGRRVLPGDDRAFEIARMLHAQAAERVVAVLTDVGSLPVTGAITLATAGWAVHRRRAIDAAALAAALALTFAAVHVAKALEGRARPVEAFVATTGMSYPSGHAAYAVALVACAVVLVRGGSSLAARFAAVTIAIAVLACVALSRVYLRAHFLSDVVGGLGLGAAVFSLVGIVGIVVGHVRHNPPP